MRAISGGVEPNVYSHQIIGWSIDDQIQVERVLEAFNMAVAGQDVKLGLILDLDRGVQYRAWEYQRVLERKKDQPMNAWRLATS